MIEHRISKEALDFSHQLRPASNFADEFLHLVEREVERMWESRDFLRVFIPRAIVDPSVGSVMNKALISVRAKAIAERLKHLRKLPHIAARRYRGVYPGDRNARPCVWLCAACTARARSSRREENGGRCGQDYCKQSCSFLGHLIDFSDFENRIFLFFLDTDLTNVIISASTRT